MDFKDCIKFANESGFYYHTGTAKSVYKQLKNNPNVEISFYHAGGDMMAENMRVAEILYAVRSL